MTQYKYNSTDLVKPVSLTDREEFLLKDSKTFCIYPWIHLHAYPTGEAYPCCHAEMKPGVVGNCRTNTLAEIWNSPKQRQLRVDMLSEKPTLLVLGVMNKKNQGSLAVANLQINITDIMLTESLIHKQMVH